MSNAERASHLRKREGIGISAARWIAASNSGQGIFLQSDWQSGFSSGIQTPHAKDHAMSVGSLFLPEMVTGEASAVTDAKKQRDASAFFVAVFFLQQKRIETHATLVCLPFLE